MLDDVHRELLEPGDGRQRDRDAASAPDPRNQDLHRLGLRRRLTRVGRAVPLTHLDGHRAPGQALDVEDQRDPAVAHERRPGEEADRLQACRERLDDDLLGVEDLVDEQAESDRVGLQDGDDGALLGGALGQAEDRAQVDQREQGLTQAVDLG